MEGKISSIMRSFGCFVFVSLCLCGENQAEQPPLQVGFGEADITPKLGGKPVYIAGFGHNRKATAIHDPLFAQAMVLKHGDRKIALVSVDLVGLFHHTIEAIRQQLPGFAYILVSSTHNHEGPDTLGLWGPNPFTSGLDADYQKTVQQQIIKSIRQADAAAKPATARLGSAKGPELIHDNREPYVKHDELVAVEFRGADEKPAGIVVQWNCHPETLNSKNTQISADFVGFTVEELRKRYRCPVVYLTGTVGGLMTSLGVEVRDADGKLLADGTFEKASLYGKRVADLAQKALDEAKSVALTPFQVRSRLVYLPLENKAFQLGRQLGVLQRPTFLWKGDSAQAEPAAEQQFDKPLCLRTEIALLQLGDLDVAAIPGEIYPELVLGMVQDPPDPGADFPDASIEPAINKQLSGRHHLLVGLANDEIGYIIPKRQWDVKEPFCYGRKSAQYGEINSVGPETAPLLCRAFREMVQGK